MSVCMHISTLSNEQHKLCPCAACECCCMGSLLITLFPIFITMLFALSGQVGLVCCIEILNIACRMHTVPGHGNLCESWQVEEKDILHRGLSVRIAIGTGVADDVQVMPQGHA